MKPEEIKARKDWLRSMHLRPVYLVEDDKLHKTDELTVYIAIAPTNVRGRGTRSQQLSLIPVDRQHSGRFVSYANRGCLFPWDDIELATDIIFKTKVAEKREELKNTYGEWKDDDEKKPSE